MFSYRGLYLRLWRVSLYNNHSLDTLAMSIPTNLFYSRKMAVLTFDDVTTILDNAAEQIYSMMGMLSIHFLVTDTQG